MFATDRDLLALEPALFKDVLWAGQTLTRGTGTLAGTTLTLSGLEVPLDTAGIQSGHVVLVGPVAYEVVTRLSATQLTISRLRASPTAAPIAPPPFTSTPCVIATFTPQIRLAHLQALRLAGVTPTGEVGPPGSPPESSITNPNALTRLEALGALHQVLSAAGAAGGSLAPLSQQAGRYRQMFREERARVILELDLDGDAKPDAARPLLAGTLLRG